MGYAVSPSIEVKGKYLGCRKAGVKADASSRSQGGFVSSNRTTMRDYAVSRKYEKRYKKKTTNSLLRFLPSALSFFKGMGVPRHRVHRGSLWTGVVLLTLSCGVRGMSQEEMPAFIPPESQDSALLSLLFRDLYEKELLRQMIASQQLQEPPEPESYQQKRAMYEQVPMPLPLSIQHGDISREDTKRASSYMALCHFKICSVGRKRSNTRLFSKFQK